MEEPEVSKSGRKREALRLQALGRELTALRPQQLEALELPDALLAALLDYQRFPSHGARRRQLQFIGRLMRELDASAIEDALADLRGESAGARYAFHQVEQWRERLLAEPETLTDFLDAFPDADRQRVRLALQRVTKAPDESRQRTAARALFRVLRDAMHADGRHQD
jgi:ribosome-associated protein